MPSALKRLKNIRLKLNKHVKISDVIFAIVIVAVSLTVFFCCFVLQPGSVIRITDHGKLLDELDLNINQEYRVDSEYMNKIIVENRVVYVKESTCPNQICVHQGKIRHAGESIICSPNGIVISIEGDQTVDAITK